MTSITVESILDESMSYSQLSVDVSFTVSDILKEPPDEIDLNDSFEEQQQEVDLKQPDLQSKQAVKTEVALRRERRILDTPIIPIEQIKNISYIILKNVTALFNTNQSNGVGIPTCISSTGERFLAIGTSMGNIALFEVEVKGYKLLRIPDERKMGAITTVSISRDNKYLVAGHETGLISLWDLYYYNLAKVQVMSASRIIKVLFCCGDHSSLIASDINGNVMMYQIQKYIWLNLKQQKLIDKTQNLYYDIKFSILDCKSEVLALCCNDYVLVVCTFPTIGIIRKIQRPQTTPQHKIPNCDLGRCIFNGETKDVLCVSWGKNIYIYTFYQDYGEIIIHYLFTFPHQYTIYNLEFITEYILITLDDNNVLRAINLEQSFKEGYSIINKTEINQQIIYQRNFKDKNNKYIKNFSNTIVNCSYQSKKEIFFICKNSVYRGRLHKWSQYIQSLIVDPTNWTQALRMCLEFYLTQLNIFAQKITINKRTKQLFTDICSLYLKSKLKEIMTGANRFAVVKDPLQQVFDIVIQFCLRIQGQSYLFNTVTQIIKNKCPTDQYEELFFSCFEPFILANMVTSIPIRVKFQSLISYFIDRKMYFLIDTLIMGLSPESIFYDDVIALCSQNKLYKSLSHVSSVNDDYITPLNKLFNEVKTANNDGLFNAESTYFQILNSNIQTFLQGKYITGIAMDAKKWSKCLQNLYVWITCQQTMQFFLKLYSKKYFNYLELLALGLLQINNNSLLSQLLTKLIYLIPASKNLSILLIEIGVKFEITNECIEYIIDSYPSDVDNFELIQFIHRYIQIIRTAMNDRFTKVINLLPYDALYFLNVLNYQTKFTIDFKKIQKPFQLAEYIIKNTDQKAIDLFLSDLLHMNSSKTMNYVIHHYNKQEISKRLRSIAQPQEKYSTVRIILKTLRKQRKINQQEINKIQIEGDIMLFYLECLCMMKEQSRIYYELREYPLDYQWKQALPIVTKYDLYSCQAILYKFQKNQKLAYELYEKVYGIDFKKNYKKIVYKEYSSGRFLKAIFEEMLSLTRSKNTWMQLLNSIFSQLEQEQDQKIIAEAIQTIYQVQQSEKYPFIKVLLQIIEITLIQVSRNTTIQEMTSQITKHIDLLNKTFLIKCLTSTLSSYSRSIYIYNLSNKMIVNDQVNDFDQIYINYKIKGVSADLICMKCGLSTKSNTIKAYPCGHGYHKECVIQNQQCQRCLKLLLGQSKYIRTMNFQKRQIAQNQPQKQQQLEQQNNQLMYKCLAYEEFLEKQSNQFKKFRQTYQNYLNSAV